METLTELQKLAEEKGFNSKTTYSQEEVEKIIANLIASYEFVEVLEETNIEIQQGLAIKWFNDHKK